jgi:hypothetical protein
MRKIIGSAVLALFLLENLAIGASPAQATTYRKTGYCYAVGTTDYRYWYGIDWHRNSDNRGDVDSVGYQFQRIGLLGWAAYDWGSEFNSSVLNAGNTVINSATWDPHANGTWYPTMNPVTVNNLSVRLHGLGRPGGQTYKCDKTVLLASS